MLSRTVLSGGYRLMRRYMEKTYWVLTGVRVERDRRPRTADRGAEGAFPAVRPPPSAVLWRSVYLPAIAHRPEPKAAVPVLRPVVLHREDEGQVVAVGQRRGDRRPHHGAAQAATLEALERRHLVPLACAVARQQRAVRAH